MNSSWNKIKGTASFRLVFMSEETVPFLSKIKNLSFFYLFLYHKTYLFDNKLILS